MQSSNAPARPRALVAIAVAVAFVLGSCSKGEPEKPQARASTAAPAAQAPAGTESPAANYAPGEALKERLARQEAATKLLEAPAPPKPATPAKAPEPVNAAKPALAAAIPAAKAPPAKSPEPVAVAAPAPPPPKPEPVKAEPPRTEVAVAKPQPAPAVTRLVQRVEPDFPREALQAGEDKGIVQARITLDERGNVTRVEVLEAHPRRLFDRSVIRALSQWRYNDGAAGRTVDIEIAFKK
jgi:protein TonB